jgi:hypothetical protein
VNKDLLSRVPDRFGTGRAVDPDQTTGPGAGGTATPTGDGNSGLHVAWMVPGRRNRTRSEVGTTGTARLVPHPTRWPWCRFGNPRAQGPTHTCTHSSQWLDRTG